MRIIAVTANVAAVFAGLYFYLYSALFFGDAAPVIAAAFFGLPLMNVFVLLRG